MEVDERTVKLNSKSVAWYWVIEYFSTLKQIDAFTLRELIERAPEIHDEELGTRVREAVALRCLEELFDPLRDPATVDAQANGHLDFSRGCEEVLEYVLQRMSVSELKSDAPESLKSFAIPFIIHKRATMGQTALSKVKDEILRGSHPFAASLCKHGRLALANEHEKDDVLAWIPNEANIDAQISEVQDCLNDTNHDNVSGNTDAQVPKVQGSLIATTLDNVEGNADAQVSMIQESLTATAHDIVDGYTDVQVSKVQEIKNADAQTSIVQDSLSLTTLGNVDDNADAQVAKPQGVHIADPDIQAAEALLSLIPIALENMDGARRDDVHVKEYFPPKRKINDFPDKCVHRQAHEIENQGDVDGWYDHYVDSKKFRLDPYFGNLSLLKTLVPLHDNADELVKKRFSQTVDRSSQEVRKYSKMGSLEECRSLENGHDERFGIVSDSNGNNNLQPNQLETAYNTDKVSQGAYGNGTHDCLSVGVINGTDLKASSVAPAFRTQGVEGKIDTYGNLRENGPDNTTYGNLHENGPVNSLEHLSKEDTEFGNNGFVNDRLKVSKKKGNIINSSCKANHASSWVSGLPVLSHCVRCNKDGSVLVCSSSNCFLVFHESCLGTPVKFDDQGNFYCPICAYSRSLLEFRKCMESFSLAKKEIFSFLNMKVMNAIHLPKEHMVYRMKHH